MVHRVSVPQDTGLEQVVVARHVEDGWDHVVRRRVGLARGAVLDDAATVITVDDGKSGSHRLQDVVGTGLLLGGRQVDVVSRQLLGQLSGVHDSGAQDGAIRPADEREMDPQHRRRRREPPVHVESLSWVVRPVVCHDTNGCRDRATLRPFLVELADGRVEDHVSAEANGVTGPLAWKDHTLGPGNCPSEELRQLRLAVGPDVADPLDDRHTNSGEVIVAQEALPIGTGVHAEDDIDARALGKHSDVPSFLARVDDRGEDLTATTPWSRRWLPVEKDPHF